MLSGADGGEYSKTSGRAGIIRSARLMCLSGPRRVELKVCLRVAGARRLYFLLFFGNNKLVHLLMGVKKREGNG